MNTSNLLAAAVARECEEVISAWSGSPVCEEENVSPSHLLWMCRKIQKKVLDWPKTKLHRWLGFIQCAMICHGIVDLDGAKAMVGKCKAHFPEEVDHDLRDHLDEENPFTLDIGGEG